MKTHKVLFLALVVSAALSVSAQAGNQKANKGNSEWHAAAPARASAPTFHSTSGTQFQSGRMIGPSQRFSSIGMGSTPTAFRQHYSNWNGGASLSQRRFTPQTLNHGNGLARFESNRARDLGTTWNNHDNRVGSIGNVNRGLTSANNHVFAQQPAEWHRDWDRRCDHWWNGHCCRFINNCWFIFDLGFFPWWGWDYYGYDDYYLNPYAYDPGVYEGQYYYDQGAYDQNADSSIVAAAQERLAREGYYRGAIDGVLGRATHRAIYHYQSDHGLRVTGYLTTDTLQSLGLRQVAGY